MKANNPRALINIFAFTSLLVSLLIRNDVLSLLLALICITCSLVILYRHLAELSNISETNPKLKAIQIVTIFNFLLIAGIVAVAILLEKGMITLTDKQSKLLLSSVLTFLMIGFGNIAPKLPFNRYTGLRLPWTVRDEETWIVAHRILGYISLPLGLITLAGSTAQMTLENWAKIWFMGPLLLWIGIPGILSGVYYWKKYSGKL